ncbi:hypothetical protein [Pseudomonas moorei]|uniref:hypothetical protein n=1 Tax=Pseudomonas moorei TaxID=395599 RepID=UPI000D4F2270|nr:hypothetical protein [Pseudomonas moorei]PPA00041.1 hypothetical protein C4E44_31930 [Pseudomonas sp. MWU12-2312b]
MCTLTHFAHPQTSHLMLSQHPELATQALRQPRFQVILAGNAFFHIKEISTGHVRGFRGDHNEACALARSLESRV